MKIKKRIKTLISPIPKQDVSIQNMDTKHDLYPANAYPSEFRLGEGIEAVPDLSPLANDERIVVPTEFSQEYSNNDKIKIIKKTAKRAWKK